VYAEYERFEARIQQRRDEFIGQQQMAGLQQQTVAPPERREMFVR
jgi:hypothetical protein